MPLGPSPKSCLVQPGSGPLALLKADLESQVIMEGSDFYLVPVSPKILIVFLVSTKVPKAPGNRIPVQELPSITFSCETLDRSLLDLRVPPVPALHRSLFSSASQCTCVCVCVHVLCKPHTLNTTSCHALGIPLAFYLC